MSEDARTETLLAGQSRALELIAGDASLQEVLEYLCRFIESHADDLRASVLLLEGDHLVHGAAPSLPPEYNRSIHGAVIGPVVGSCGTAAFLGRPVIVEDIATDPLWAPYKHLALPHGLRACWSTPILSRKGAVLGTFALYYPAPGPPRASHCRLVQVVTHLAGVAIERHRADEALRQRAEALARADRRKDEFLATLGHELRNPLAPIVTALELMRVRAADPAAVERYRAVVERQVGTLTRLVDDLLDVSRIARGKITLARQRITAQAVVGRALETTRPLLDRQRQHVTVDLPAAPLEIDGDPVRLSQVLSNVLGNASKYTASGGHVHVAAAREGSEVVLTVRDDGIGLTPEMLPRIFDAFVQADASLDRARGGLGIGLTLVKSLIEMHGGRVLARSEGLGKGTEVEIRLPAAPPPAAAAPSPPDAAPPPDASPPPPAA